ncbi:MAG: hypothetical protein ACI9WC_003682, partial [Arenicella sp.]
RRARVTKIMISIIAPVLGLGVSRACLAFPQLNIRPLNRIEKWFILMVDIA